MVNEKLTAYFEIGIARDFSYEQLKNALVRQNFSESDIREAYNLFLLSSKTKKIEDTRKKEINWLQVSSYIGFIILFFSIVPYVASFFVDFNYNFFRGFLGFIALFFIFSVISIFYYGFSRLGDYTESRLLKSSALAMIALLFFGLIVFGIFLAYNINFGSKTIITGNAIGDIADCSSDADLYGLREEGDQICTCKYINGSFSWSCNFRCFSDTVGKSWCEENYYYCTCNGQNGNYSKDCVTEEPGKCDYLAQNSGLFGGAMTVKQKVLIILFFVIPFVLIIMRILFSISLIRIRKKIKFAELAGILDIIFSILLLIFFFMLAYFILSFSSFLAYSVFILEFILSLFFIVSVFLEILVLREGSEIFEYYSFTAVP